MFDWAWQDSPYLGFLMLCCQIQLSLESSEDATGMELKMASLLIYFVPQLDGLTSWRLAEHLSLSM